jgi:hypothetical protein
LRQDEGAGIEGPRWALRAPFFVLPGPVSADPGSALPILTGRLRRGAWVTGCGSGLARLSRAFDVATNQAIEEEEEEEEKPVPNCDCLGNSPESKAIAMGVPAC